ncbi:perilipin-3-like [Molothrus ater]|uniref:perilipin-3-like n=1 Tax=Molothrus ater TaxID=84834 RepID=UPI00174B0EE5|nr:perilipin-3-like [Molothrus ater]
MASGKTPTPDLLKAEEQQTVSAVNRVTSLPLLNSAFNLVSSAYNQTKESHPCLSGVCSVAETVAAVAVGSVVGGAQPILSQLEPQIALVNEYACKGLDQLEENLPFLQQPADKVISDTKQLVATKVTSAMDAACEAKEAVADKVTEAVDLTKNVVGDSVKLTRSVVTSTVSSAVEAAQGAKELVTSKVTEAVDVTKHMVEDSVDRTKSAVASTIVNAVEAAQGAKELVTSKVTEAVDLSKHLVEDSVDRTKSAVTSTITAAVGAAQGAKELVTNKVTDAVDKVTKVVDGAKDLVANKVTEAVDLTKGAVQDSVEKTKSVVTSTVSTAVSQAVAGGVESVLGMSEDLVDHYLPMTEEELGKLATMVQGFGVASVEEQKRQRSYFVRLGSLSGRVRHRAYQHSLAKLQGFRHRTQDPLSRLQLAIKLIESVKQEVGQKLLEGQQKLHQLWVDWSLTQPKGNQVRTACQAEVEPRTLAMLRILTQQLQPAYHRLKLSIHGLPSSIQEAVSRAARHIHKLHSSFSRAGSFQDLSRTTLARSQDRVAEARRSLDVLFEYVTHNTPLNWIVGPFRAMAKVAQDSRRHKKEEMRSDRKLPKLEKAPLSQEVKKAPEEPKGTNRLSEKWYEVLEKLEEKAGKDTERKVRVAHPARALVPEQFPSPGCARPVPSRCPVPAPPRSAPPALIGPRCFRLSRAPAADCQR